MMINLFAWAAGLIEDTRKRVGEYFSVRDLSFREAVAYYTVAGAHTPKPERMYDPLIRSGRAKIIRRRGRCPLIVPARGA